MDGIPAVVLCNSFPTRMNGNTSQFLPVVLLPLRKISPIQQSNEELGPQVHIHLILEHILNSLVNNGVKRVLLLCTSFGELVQAYVDQHTVTTPGASAQGSARHLTGVEIHVHNASAKHCVSVADALREIYRTPSLTAWLFSGALDTKDPQKSKRKSADTLSSADFLLVKGDALLFEYNGLQDEIKRHQIEKQKNSRLLFSLLSISRGRKTAEKPCSGSMHDMFGSESVTLKTAGNDYLLGRVSMRKLFSGESALSVQSLEFTQAKLKQLESLARLFSTDQRSSAISLKSHISDAGIAICSSELLAVMKENFDFTSLDDCISTYVPVNDDILGSTDEAYENEEVSRAINHYDIRLPILTTGLHAQSPTLSTVSVDDGLGSYLELIGNESLVGKSVTGRFQPKVLTGEAVRRYFRSIFLFDWTDGGQLNDASDWEDRRYVESEEAFGHLVEYFCADIRPHRVESGIRDESQRLDFHGWMDLVVDDYKSCSQEGGSARKKQQAGCVTYAKPSMTQNTTEKEDSSQFFEEICEVLMHSISLMYIKTAEEQMESMAESEIPSWGEVKTAIDAENTLISTLIVHPNNLQVSLSQMRFTYNQKPREFGLAFLLAVLRLAFKESCNQSFIQSSADTKKSKQIQKLFQNYVSTFSPFLNEERFGGGDTYDASREESDGLARVLLILVEISKYPNVHARMPYFLKILYEADVVSDEEIFDVDEFIQMMRPNVKGIHRLFTGYDSLPVDSVSEIIFEVWDHCEPFLKALDTLSQAY